MAQSEIKQRQTQVQEQKENSKEDKQDKQESQTESDNIEEREVDPHVDIESEKVFKFKKSVPALIIRQVGFQLTVFFLIGLLSFLVAFFLPLAVIPLGIAIIIALIIDAGFTAYFVRQWLTTEAEVHTFTVAKQAGVLVSKPGKIFLKRGNSVRISTYILETYQKASVRKGPIGALLNYGDILLIDSENDQIDVIDLVHNPDKYLEKIQTIIDMSSTEIVAAFS